MSAPIKGADERALVAAEDLIANRWGYPDEASSRASVLSELRAVIKARASLGAAQVPSLSVLRKAAHAGYMAACREVFALVEDTRKSSNIVDDFTRGRCFEAKGIARTMGAIGPENSDELREALREVMRATLSQQGDAS